jgi:hypothetical protein
VAEGFESFGEAADFVLVALQSVEVVEAGSR